MSFPSLSYIDDSAMLQAKTLANPALNLFLNHALSKQIEFLNVSFFALYSAKINSKFPGKTITK